MILALAIGLAGAAPAQEGAPMPSLYDFTLKDIDGRDRSLAEFKGQVLLLVNVASKCGFTKQYAGLEKLYQTYQDRGFAVLGFPANNFMGQEPGTEAEIKSFCTLTYGVKFPMYEKVVVKGPQATGLYRQLAAATGVAPGWNFHKYVIGRDGTVRAQFPSRVRPDAPELVAAIEQALAEPVPR